MRTSILGLILAVLGALDMNSWCSGFCSDRYQAGFYDLERHKCGCIDYYPVNLSGRISVPHHPKTKEDSTPPGVFDGEGIPHVYEIEDQRFTF